MAIYVLLQGIIFVFLKSMLILIITEGSLQKNASNCNLSEINFAQTEGYTIYSITKKK